MYRTSCQTGKHLMRDDLENHLKTRSFRSEKWLNIFRSLPKTCQSYTNFVRKSCQDFSSDTHWLRGESGREVSWLQTLRMSKRTEPFLRDVIDMIFLGREASIRELPHNTNIIGFLLWMSVSIRHSLPWLVKTLSCPILQDIAASKRVSGFFLACLMVSLNSSSSGSMK